jgi:membrane-bound lytic murein transglycosylase D
MAATVISKSPEEFGFTDIEYQDEWIYDEVEIDKCLDLKVIAKELGASLQLLKALNPELLRNFTPPNSKNYKLRVPKGSRDKFLAIYDDLPSSKKTSFVRHKIRRGETVSTIARRYGVSQNAIFQANNLSRRSKIYAGKTLIVPVPNDGYSSGSKRPPREYQSKGNYYYVRSGDTVWDIARAFGTSSEKIRRLNNLDRRARIHVGQKLQIFENTLASATSSTKTSSNKSSGSTSGKSTTYKVRKGDTLWEIALKFGTSVSKIRAANGMGRRSRIYPNQRLTIPGSDSPNFKIYTIRRGDTLSGIAYKNRTTVSKLMAWNDLRDPGMINVGDKLKIYYD